MNKRKDQESKEGLETIQNGAPKGRFQTEQQIQNTTDADAKITDASFTLEKKASKGSQLKQEAVAKVLRDADSGSPNSGMGISAAGLRGVSGAAGGVLGAANGTPIADKSRSSSRYGKKLDRIATKLNYTPSEQIVNEFDESKPLADAHDADQGYNGTYRNEYARSQKKVGNTPAELMFDRSVDYIFKDQLYFGQGQYVKQEGVTYYDAPTVKAEMGDYGIVQYPDSPNYNVKPGNYLHKNMHVTLSDRGKVEEIFFDVEDVTASGNAEECNRASAAGMIDRNAAELDRQSIDAKAGDEKADIWCPLARAVKQPTQVVGLLRDFEQMTGNEVLLAYRKASTSMSHQLNRAKKDGQTLVDPAVEALIGILEDANDASVLASAYPTIGSIINNNTNQVTRKLYSAGCSGLMINAYDSVAKYLTKQDLLLQPRSFRMHLQTADNNMNPLRANKRFAQIIDIGETYSTIDRDYDPLLPICITDKAAIIHRYNFNELFARIKGLKSFSFKTSVSNSTEYNDVVILDGRLTTSAITNKWYVHVLISDNSEGHGAFTTTGGVFTPNNSMDSGTKVLVIVNTSATQIASLAVDNITYYEQQSPVSVSSYPGQSIIIKVPTDVEDSTFETRSALDGGDYAYNYSDLRNNYTVTTNVPLIQGLIKYFEDSIGSKIYSLLVDGKLTIPMVHSTQYFSLWSFMICAATPFIINERINSMRDVLYYEKNVEYPFSQLEAIGSIGVKSYSNFTYTDYDSPIDAGIMKPVTAFKWIFPEMFWKPKQTVSNGKTTAATVVMPFYMNQENYYLESDGTATVDVDHAAMTMPSIRSGVRLAFLDTFYGVTEKDIRLSYDCCLPFVPAKAVAAYVYKYGQNTDGIITFNLADTDDADISIQEWLEQPREIGYIIDAPYGVLTPKVTGSITAGVISSSRASFAESATRGTSFRIKCYAGDGYLKHVLSSGSDDILKTAAINVNRATNFKQVWYSVVSNGKRPTFDSGMLFSINHLLSAGSLNVGESTFAPFYNERTNLTLSSINVVSFMKAMWTRIQKLPFVVSPFEGADVASATISTSIDPYEIAYYFGLCGFRASDYRESVYNREKEVVNQGFLFVNDPWVIDSPLFKEGAVSSGVTTTRGYEV